MFSLVAVSTMIGVGIGQISGAKSSSCGTFRLGGACSPNTEYVTLVATADAAACIAACEAQKLGGCCWHRPTMGPKACQWVVGGHTFQDGGDAVRSSTECTGPPQPPGAPEQVHIAFGATPDTMVVQWAVAMRGNALANVTALGPVLTYWDRGQTAGTNGTRLTPTYTAVGPGAYVQFRVTIAGLAPMGAYSYSVGWLVPPSGVDGYGSDRPMLTPPATFHMPPVAEADLADYSARLVMFGDLGWTDDQILPFLQQECAAGAVDAIVIFGDMVYWDNGENENSFLRDMSNMATSGGTSVPIMTSPGNGDSGANYARYKAQWAMPGWEKTASLYHSFDIGRAHIVGINTEDIEHGGAAVMLAWLDADLQAANTKAARVTRPWVVVHFHRPAYSTGNTDAIPYKVFEPIMYKYGVDIVFSGHVHNQERTFPVYNSTLVPSPDPSRPYENALAPVYVVSGNPGNAEETSIWNRGFDDWTAWRSYHFGYSHMTVHNSTTLAVDFLSSNMGGATTDSFVLTKNQSCNFGGLCAPTTTAATSSSGDAVGIGAGRTTSSDRMPSVAAAAMLTQGWRRASAVAGGVPGSQIEALVELYNSTGGPDWNHSTNWLSGDPCDPERPWHGVSCARITERTLPGLWNQTAPRDGVTALHLVSNNLHGEIPAALGPALSPTIQLIDLSSNCLSGTLPQSLLRGLPRLHSLFIEPKFDDRPDWRLNGSLPDDMGAITGLPNLRFISLSRNQLTGPIPSSLGQLPCHVQHASGEGHNDPSPAGEVGCLIWLERNNLTGAVPHALCNRTFNEVYISGNDLSCPRPCVSVAYGAWPTCSQPCTPC